jgi:hypothetical protein
MVVFFRIEITDNTSNAIFAGTYREASVYGLSLNTIQFTDNITYYHNNHKHNRLHQKLMRSNTDS